MRRQSPAPGSGGKGPLRATDRGHGFRHQSALRPEAGRMPRARGAHRMDRQGRFQGGARPNFARDVSVHSARSIDLLSLLPLAATIPADRDLDLSKVAPAAAAAPPQKMSGANRSA